ncbi:kinesin-like protein KIN-14K [Citrus sinensis]|uniref:Kinesin-like protein KIN-14K n=1 Tax=Citrus sinensis TaxID=2711 RepID=A0ACB8LZG0_CITSI|nr:kinesin-like protein KIN-14K [Citrus sinensis]
MNGPEELKRSNSAFESSVNINSEVEAKQRALLIEWLNSILPNLNFPIKASDEELRACLIDGTVLCQILKRLKPASVDEANYSYNSSMSRSGKIARFLTTLGKLGISRFEMSDLEKGSMKPVINCLLNLRAEYITGGDIRPLTSISTKSGSRQGDVSSPASLSPLFGEERRKVSSDSQFQRGLRSPVMSEPSTALLHHVGHKFHEVFQLKQGRYSDLPAAKITEMMKSTSLDNAPTQSLLSVVNGILDESVDRKNGEIPHQNNLFKTREEKYQSRIRVLEALASGTGEETEIVMNQLQQIKTEKSKLEEKKKLEDDDVAKLMKEKDQQMLENLALKQELEMAKKTYELRCLQRETEYKGANSGFEERIKELEHLLQVSRNKVRELEANSDSKYQRWSRKESIYQSFMDLQHGALRELRFSSDSIKQEISKAQKSHADDLYCLGVRLKALAGAAENYHAVLAENRRLFNEVQDLKGNIRVYCRIRPFLPGQTKKQTTIEYIGENGELIFGNPSKPGKDGQRMFKFNKVFGPDATQAEVFSDTQPLIRSVLDGYNVCIFAYGQTGSGKTYTMSGPSGPHEEDWGVNYRALNDLFNLSQNRRSSIMYEVAVQMVEIYNEQHLVFWILAICFLDLHTLGIMSTSQPNGLAVPDASMHPVTSTEDVLELMDIGLKNRAIGATALNERSSRSHSVVTVHVRGKDLKTGIPLHGNLHLVDLAGSERVDRSEATGDRLKEAQHINKSLSALGDVIFALAQKSPHVPYRNSKLTQVLQSSLGGQAKTLMLVQLNPDVNSYSESLSTLKFAERVSGVELGAARSSKEGRDVRELMEQVASLKDTIAKKDDEIERLQLLKDLKNVYPGVNSEKRGLNTFRYRSLFPNTGSIDGTPLSKAQNHQEEADGSAEYNLHHEGNRMVGEFGNVRAANGECPLVPSQAEQMPYCFWSLYRNAGEWTVNLTERNRKGPLDYECLVGLHLLQGLAKWGLKLEM